MTPDEVREKEEQYQEAWLRQRMAELRKRNPKWVVSRQAQIEVIEVGDKDGKGEYPHKVANVNIAEDFELDFIEKQVKMRLEQAKPIGYMVSLIEEQQKSLQERSKL